MTSNEMLIDLAVAIFELRQKQDKAKKNSSPTLKAAVSRAEKKVDDQVAHVFATLKLPRQTAFTLPFLEVAR